MGRGSTQDLLRAVVKTLSGGPKAINEIAEATGFDRIAITKYLEVLKECDLLSEKTDGRKRVFKLESGLSFRDDTYFGLPIEPEKEKVIDALYASIRRYWFEKTKRYPSQVDVQKTLFRVNKERKLDLPVGWYIFGALCVKPYDPSFDYPFHSLPKDVEQSVKAAVDVYSKNEFGYQIKIQQYREEGNTFYLLKEEILSILYSCNFSKRSVYVLNKKVKELFGLAPKTEDAVYNEILSEYQDLISQVLSISDEELIKGVQPELTSSFENVWKLIATYNYKQDLGKISFYSKDVLDRNFRIDIVQQEREVVERCSYLQSLLPPEEEPTDSRYLEIKKALASIKELSDEEKSKRKAVIDKIRKEKGDKGVQDFVLKQFNVS